jgi:hypothetical protein
MVLRWTGAAMLEAAKGFRRPKARKQPPILRRHWPRIKPRMSPNPTLNSKSGPPSLINQ